MVETGQMALLIALMVTGYVVVASFVGAWRKIPELTASGRYHDRASGSFPWGKRDVLLELNPRAALRVHVKEASTGKDVIEYGLRVFARPRPGQRPRIIFSSFPTESLRPAAAARRCSRHHRGSRRCAGPRSISPSARHG